MEQLQLAHYSDCGSANGAPTRLCLLLLKNAQSKSEGDRHRAQAAEILELVADVTGTYKIQIEPGFWRAGAGRYEDRGDRVTREQRERELQQQVANEQLRGEKLSQELDQLRKEQGVASPAPSPEDKLASRFATLILTIGGTRSPDSSHAVLRIPSGTEQVRLQLNLRENNYARYQAVLESAAGNTIFTSKQLAPIKSRTGANLAIVVPARMFTSGDYILTLRGVSKTGEAEDVSKSLFRVERG